MSKLGNFLEYGQKQNLQMSQKLAFAIRILALSANELNLELKNFALENPFIELHEDPGQRFDEIATNLHNKGQDIVIDKTRLNIEYFKSDSQRTSLSQNKSDESCYAIENQVAFQSLKNYLLWQLNLSRLNFKEIFIGRYLIDLIDDNGYLRTPLTDITENLSIHIKNIAAHDVEKILRLIQKYDPPGVGASSLKECLSLQLSSLDKNTPHLSLATKIVLFYLDDLGKGDIKKLCRQLDVNESEIRKAVSLVKSLNPKPGANFYDSHESLIIPDVIAVKQNNGIYKAELNPYAYSSLSLNKALLKICDNNSELKSSAFIKNNLKEAFFLIKCLRNRNETLLKVSNLILQEQHSFMKKGALYLKPLTLKQIAKLALVHESTVSRITNLKYMQTPSGTFELKHFFSASISTGDGQSSSALSVKSVIKQIIDGEDCEHPQSDAEILKKLLAKGFKLSRRTVTKYRQALGIDSALNRKSLTR